MSAQQQAEAARRAAQQAARAAQESARREAARAQAATKQRFDSARGYKPADGRG